MSALLLEVLFTLIASSNFSAVKEVLFLHDKSHLYFYSMLPSFSCTAFLKFNSVEFHFPLLFVMFFSMAVLKHIELWKQ